jgi:hypothetical protein
MTNTNTNTNTEQTRPIDLGQALANFVEAFDFMSTGPYTFGQLGPPPWYETMMYGIRILTRTLLHVWLLIFVLVIPLFILMVAITFIISLSPKIPVP